MKLKVGKHISTTTTILGLLVLTSAVAHADTAQQLEKCIKQRMYRCVMDGETVVPLHWCNGESDNELKQVMSEQTALEICKEASRSRKTQQRRQSN